MPINTYYSLGFRKGYGLCNDKAHVLLNCEKALCTLVFTNVECNLLFAERKIIPAVQYCDSLCCLKRVAPRDTFAWAGFWQHDLIIMLNRCSSCLYTNSLAIQMSTVFVILKSVWYQSESFFFWLAFSKDNLCEFSTEAAASAQCIWLSFNHLAILGLKMLLYLGLLESCDVKAGVNAFFPMCIHCVIGFMCDVLCLLPRRLLLGERWNQRRGIFVMCNGNVSVKDMGLSASSEHQ